MVVNYGVVGTGYFGAELARYMKENDGAVITVVYDPEKCRSCSRRIRSPSGFITR